MARPTTPFTHKVKEPWPCARATPCLSTWKCWSTRAVVGVCVAVGEGRCSLFCSLCCSVCCSVCCSGCGEIQCVLQLVLHFFVAICVAVCVAVDVGRYSCSSFTHSPSALCCYPVCLATFYSWNSGFVQCSELGPRIWCCASDLEGTMWPWRACCKLLVACFVKYVLRVS